MSRKIFSGHSPAPALWLVRTHSHVEQREEPLQQAATSNCTINNRLAASSMNSCSAPFHKPSINMMAMVCGQNNVFADY